MNDTGDAFDERIREAARDYNEPPPPPREVMWAAIREARSPARTSRRGPGRLAGWGWRITALAAAIVVGIALGRMTVAPGPANAPATTARASAAPANGPVGAELYDVAATEHLGRAEALLVQFRTGSSAAPVDGEVVGWARDLLTTTRLLLDSPAAENAGTRALLEDLELVLVQIVQLPGGDAGERELIEEGIAGRHMLLRLRAAVPSGPVRVGT